MDFKYLKTNHLLCLIKSIGFGKIISDLLTSY